MLYGWSPTIGGPTVYGLLAAIAYFVTAWLCYRNWNKARQKPPHRSRVRLRSRARRRFWLIATLVLLALGVYKQLDIQTLFTDIGRVTAKQEGWYAIRRGFQREFIAVVAAVSVLCCITLPLLARRVGSWEMTGTIGLIILTAFVTIRAVSLHHIDAVLNLAWEGIKVSHLLELSGILLVGLAALARSHSVQR